MMSNADQVVVFVEGSNLTQKGGLTEELWKIYLLRIAVFAELWPVTITNKNLVNILSMKWTKLLSFNFDVFKWPI